MVSPNVENRYTQWFFTALKDRKKVKCQWRQKNIGQMIRQVVLKWKYRSNSCLCKFNKILLKFNIPFQKGKDSPFYLSLFIFAFTA